MNFFMFVVSVSLSIVGAFSDFYTTYIFRKDGGIELERNKRVRDAFVKGEYGKEVLVEAFIIIVFGIVDSFEVFNSFLFFGLIFLVSKGLAATDNLKAIVTSRSIGMKTYLEQEKSRRQAFQNISIGKKIEFILSELVGTSICLILYLILLTADFPFVVLARYFAIGLVYYFILKAYYLFKTE